MRIYGYHPIHEVLRRDPAAVERVLIVAGRTGHRRSRIEELCRCHSIPVAEVREIDLDLDSRQVHNGFIAEVEADRQAVSRIGRDPGLVVLLEDIQDPRNLGAIVRICDGVGVGRLMVRDRGSAPLTAAAVKASAGAAEWLEPERVTNSANEIKRLKDQGFWVYGADAEGRPPWEIDLKGEVAICLGGEEKGLRHRTRSLCDELIGLPMLGGVASLNVSAAAAALLYEALRQRS